jgi:hypothetical protein
VPGGPFWAAGEKTISNTALAAPSGAWPLLLDAELCEHASAAGGAERLAALKRRMARTGRFETVSAELHCSGGGLRVRVTVDAPDLTTAVQLAADRLRAAARLAGLGPVVLVGAGLA